MTQAAIYARISADREGQSLGVARQEADCRALAERLGWAVVAIYIDNDVSAYSGKSRPEYRKLLADVRSGAIQGVLAYHSDRLYRRGRDLAEFIDTVTAARCAVETVAAGKVDLSTATGLMSARVGGAIAEFSSDQQSERIRRKLAANRAEGKPHGGHRPYGWEPNRMTIRESEAATIRWGIGQTLAGVALLAQVRELNERGTLTATGKKWTHTTYRGVLLTERHAGLMRDGSPASWPAIITPEQHRAVKRLLEDPARVQTPGRNGRVHLLSGVPCGVCGGPMRVGKSKSARSEAYDAYRCAKNWCVNRRVDHVDEFVRAVMAARLRRPDVARLLGDADTEEEKIARLVAENEAERLRQMLDEAAEEHAKAGLSVRQLAAYCVPLREQLSAAEKAAEPPQERGAVLGGVLAARDRGASFLALSVERQRAVIELLAEVRIGRGLRGNTFRPDGIEITWR